MPVPWPARLEHVPLSCHPAIDVAAIEPRGDFRHCQGRGFAVPQVVWPTAGGLATGHVFAPSGCRCMYTDSLYVSNFIYQTYLAYFHMWEGCAPTLQDDLMDLIGSGKLAHLEDL